MFFRLYEFVLSFVVILFSHHVALCCELSRVIVPAAHCVAVESARDWKISKTKAANKIGGIVALVMASLEAVKEQSQPFEVLGAW